MNEHTTNTSKWALAIHRVTETSVEVWVGALFPTLVTALKARVRLKARDGSVRTGNISKSDCKRPFSRNKQRFFALVKFRRLKPNTHCKVKFHRHVEPLNNARPAEWQNLRSGQFDTLPVRIPTENQAPFTIGIGNCFYDHRDGGQAASAYQALYERAR